MTEHSSSVIAWGGEDAGSLAPLQVLLEQPGGRELGGTLEERKPNVRRINHMVSNRRGSDASTKYIRESS